MQPKVLHVAGVDGSICADIDAVRAEDNRAIDETFALGAGWRSPTPPEKGGFTLREVDLFGLFLSVQMLLIIALGLHNRHLAALVREKSSVIDILRRTLGSDGATTEQRAAPGERLEVAADD